jgi:glycosyltransferase involved in cell wall biosynthesis
MTKVEIIEEVAEVAEVAEVVAAVPVAAVVEVPIALPIVPVAEVPRKHTKNRIILNLMIKNESRIIVRCLEHALRHVDAISILDTGSTDDTVAICEKYLATCGSPYLISVEPFRTFGYNRTVSFQKAQELCASLSWDPTTTYAMAVDADMVIVPSDAFRHYHMTQNGYHAIQANGHIKYFNTRFMKCSYPWKCIGATHEYWSGDPSDRIPYEIFYIDDRNDGGCKSDKFERDVRLLLGDIQEDAGNVRAHFYLAQTYHNLSRHHDAITYYKKRIAMGGWYEEVWYSHYQLGKCYEALKDEGQMERWMNKAFQVHSRRAEPLYFLTKYFRETSQHFKAHHYYLKGRGIPYPKDDALFVENSVYEGLFDYEATILACYVHGTSRQDSLCEVVSYLNRGVPFHRDNVWDNLFYYVEPLTSRTYGGEYSRLLLRDHEEYKVSSCCVIPFSDEPARRYLLNARYVNYSIDSKGCYHMRSADGHVKTRNGSVFLNASYAPTEEIQIMEESYERHAAQVEGLEDIRLFSHNGVLWANASSKNASANDKIEMVVGRYDVDRHRIHEVRVVNPPRPTGCEKNWIYVPAVKGLPVAAQGRMNFIYGWNPLEIGAVMENGALSIHTTYATPAIFGRFRGSSRPVEYRGAWYAVTHMVKYSTPRIYSHSVVRLDKDTLRPLAFSAPFSFCDNKIEYCIGFDVAKDVATFFFSRNDTDASMIRLPMSTLRMIPC